MNLTNKLKTLLRDLFAPGAAAYDDRRSYRVVIISVLAGIIIAVAFGVALYHLNNHGRLER